MLYYIWPHKGRERYPRPHNYMREERVTHQPAGCLLSLPSSPWHCAISLIRGDKEGRRKSLWPWKAAWTWNKHKILVLHWVSELKSVFLEKSVIESNEKKQWMTEGKRNREKGIGHRPFKHPVRIKPAWNYQAEAFPGAPVERLLPFVLLPHPLPPRNQRLIKGTRECRHKKV